MTTAFWMTEPVTMTKNVTNASATTSVTTSGTAAPVADQTSPLVHGDDVGVVGDVTSQVNSTWTPDALPYNDSNLTRTTELWLDPLLPATDVCANLSTTNVTTLVDDSLAEIHHVVAGVIIFIVVLPLVLFDFRCLPFGTTSAVLLGAMMMVLTRVVSQQELYDIIGRRDYLSMLFMLLGLMLLVQYVEREQLLVSVLRRFLKAHHSFENYIWRVCLLSFVLSALFTSDACCAILTPVVLKFWEVQERSRTEQGCILLAIATSANIGGVASVFGAPHMALIAARTAAPLLKNSRLDMRACVTYLLPTALMAFLFNVGFLILHYRFRNRGFERGNLVSEPSSQCEQEMTGLTRENNNQKFHQNGFLRLERNDLANEIANLREERILNPCQLETIPEDEILEISSNSPSISAREVEEVSGLTASGGAATADADAIIRIGNDSDVDEDEDEGGEPEVTESSFTGHNQIRMSGIQVEYRPSALQASRSQSFGQLAGDSDTSLSKSLEQHGLKLSQKAGIYRSVGAFSAVDFLPPEAGMQQLSHSISCQTAFSPGDSRAFHGVLILLLLGIFAILLASTDALPFDMGLVAMAAAVFAILADSVLNGRSSVFIIKRVDWSIIIMFFGIFVWIQGLNNTHIPRWLWVRTGLAESEVLFRFSLSADTIAIACLFIVLGGTVFGQVPMTLIVLHQLVPCADQLLLVLLLAWCVTVAGNLTLLNSVANLIVVQKAAKTIRYRLTFCNHLQFGFLTTLIILPIGVLILYGLLYVSLQ